MILLTLPRRAASISGNRVVEERAPAAITSELRKNTRMSPSVRARLVDELNPFATAPQAVHWSVR